jgi:diacylglycerol kinase family enzyme
VAPEIVLERAEEFADRLLPERTPKRRMLVIVNPYATTVSERLKNLVVYALQSRYAVQAVETERREHATQLTREAAGEGFEVVVAFGGDGTVNEAANGLVGSRTPLTVLPGGSTNVWCRSLGIPNDVVDATEHLLGLADEFRPFPVDLGLANDRHFVFSSGVGLDASVVERVDAHPHRKARFGPWYYTLCGIGTFNRRYLRRPPRVRVRSGGAEVEAVTVVVQNSDPYTYFASRPIRVCEDAGLDTGTLSLTALRRASLLELPTLIPRLLSGSASTVVRHRQVTGLRGVAAAHVETADGRPFPFQMDGDYIGDVELVEYRAVPSGLLAVA